MVQPQVEPQHVFAYLTELPPRRTQQHIVLRAEYEALSPGFLAIIERFDTGVITRQHERALRQIVPGKGEHAIEPRNGIDSPVVQRLE